MNPILQNLTGLVFLLVAETGCYIQGFQRSTKRERVNVFDASVGYSTGFYSFEPEATYNNKGFISGTTGMAAAAPGVTLALANTTAGNGVAVGGVYTDTTDLSHNAKTVREIGVTATQMPGIT